ncbi:von Willebrand factor type A [Aphelenchoides avenae]|nr:von Willebrand factor type A [Aphelenchus avenae]
MSHRPTNRIAFGGVYGMKVLIGDDRAHEKDDYQITLKIDWKEELDKLKEKGVVVHGVQALNRQHASDFYAECARRTGGCHLALHQFSSIIVLVMAVCYRESARRDRLEEYEQEVQGQVGRYSRAVRQMFDNLLGRENVTALPPGTAR